MMTRTIISLDSRDKQWLERKAAAEGVSMGKLVREAVRRMRQQEDISTDELLQQTRGLWKAGDALA